MEIQRKEFSFDGTQEVPPGNQTVGGFGKNIYPLLEVILGSEGDTPDEDSNNDDDAHAVEESPTDEMELEQLQRTLDHLHGDFRDFFKVALKEQLNGDSEDQMLENILEQYDANNDSFLERLAWESMIEDGTVVIDKNKIRNTAELLADMIIRQRRDMGDALDQLLRFSERTR